MEHVEPDAAGLQKSVHEELESPEGWVTEGLETLEDRDVVVTLESEGKGE